jgi:hypothetical protein
MIDLFLLTLHRQQMSTPLKEKNEKGWNILALHDVPCRLTILSSHINIFLVWRSENVVKLECLDVTVLRLGVGEVRGERGELQHADKCGGECNARKNAFITELETSARTESKRMTNHNTPQLSRMDQANHCAVFPALSLLITRTVYSWITYDTWMLG